MYQPTRTKKSIEVQGYGAARAVGLRSIQRCGFVTLEARQSAGAGKNMLLRVWKGEPRLRVERSARGGGI